FLTGLPSAAPYTLSLHDALPIFRPALYEAWMDIQPAAASTAPALSRTYDVVGPVCETGDFLGMDRELNVAAGDLLAVFSAGAYGVRKSTRLNSSHVKISYAVFCL